MKDQPKQTKPIYSHAYTIDFSLRSHHRDEEVTAEELVAALKTRITDLENQPEELVLACEASLFDTYEEYPGTMESVQVCGSHGTLTVCGATGHILTPTVDVPEAYRDLSCFDLAEYRAYCDSVGGPLPDEIDIVDLGVTTVDGRHEPPDYDHRNGTALQRIEAERGAVCPVAGTISTTKIIHLPPVSPEEGYAHMLGVPESMSDDEALKIVDDEMGALKAADGVVDWGDLEPLLLRRGFYVVAIVDGPCWDG